MLSRQQRVCLAICTPMPKKIGPLGDLIYDTITPNWHRSRVGLSVPTNINTMEVFADGLEVGDARSKVAARLLTYEQVPEFLFFIDYDVLLPPDALTKLFFRARTFPEHDIYAGVYCCKGHNPPDPLIYGDNGQGSIWNWTVGDLITTQSHGVKSVHMGLTLIRTSLFQKLKDQGLVHGTGDDQEDEPFFKTVNMQLKDAASGALARLEGTEDIYFCDKAIKAGATIMVDTSVLAGHEDKNTGIVYGLPYKDGPAARAKWMPDENGEVPDHKEGKIALDIGAGKDRRTWEGHKTYTTDIDPKSGADYIQDTRMLNLPDDHFDLVASSHHLEHLGRWDQEAVFKEMFRVTKPGGRWEHVLPNTEWAAAKIVAGETDGHVLNVLYGSQEAAGIPRVWNTHFFCFTPAIAKGLAEAAGMTDVEVEDYKVTPELGYTLILRARKPVPGEATSEPAKDTVVLAESSESPVDVGV